MCPKMTIEYGVERPGGRRSHRPNPVSASAETLTRKFRSYINQPTVGTRSGYPHLSRCTSFANLATFVQA